MSFELISSPENYAPEHHSLLGQRRSQTIISYLIEKGCDADQLVPFGYGHGAPLIEIKNFANEFLSFLKDTIQNEHPIRKIEFD